MNRIIKGLIAGLLLTATFLALCSCKNTENDIANNSDLLEYNDIVIQIEANDINSFQEKITDAKNENLLNENSLYLMTILEEQTCELDGFIVKRITYTEKSRVKERDYPINNLSIIWVKEDNKDNIEDLQLDLDIELVLFYWPNYSKTYIADNPSLSPDENIYEIQSKLKDMDVMKYFYFINNCTFCRLRAKYSCIDYEDVVEIFKRISNTIDIK